MQVLKIVTQQGYATIDALALRFGTSHQTIRRDIIEMDRRRLLQRYHGGAGVINNRARPLYADKQQLAVNAKRAIADRAVRWVLPGMSIFIDVGTTAEALAHSLLGSGTACRVITPSLNVALTLAEQASVETIIVGGLVKSRDGAAVGELAVSTTSMFKYDYAFIGFSGFDADGSLMDFDLNKVLVKQAAIRHANTAVGLVDASKYRRQASVRLAPPGALGYLVSDAKPHQELHKKLLDSGVRMVLADSNTP